MSRQHPLPSLLPEMNDGDVLKALADNKLLQQRVAALEAENHELFELLGKWPSYLSEIEELAWDSQGEWAGVVREKSPQWTAGYKGILELIEDYKHWRDVDLQNKTT